MAEIQFYIADTETTGLNIRMHEIFQLSLIRAKDRCQLTLEIQVEKPQLASFDALRITGKTIADLSRGVTKLQAIRDVEEFLAEDEHEPSHRCLILHNAAFDRKFLQAMWQRFNRRLPFDLYLDTIPMYKDYARRQGLGKISAKLDSACEQLGLKKFGASHSALGDTRHTYLLWERLSKEIDFMDHIQQHPHHLPKDE